MEYTEKEQQHKEALDEARHAEKPDKEAAAPEKDSAKQPIIDISSDAPILFGIGLASLKDLLDWAGIGSLPAIGTVITFIFIIAIAMLLFLADSRGFSQNLIMLLGGGGIEAFLFGLNFLPLFTATVLSIYIKMIIRRKSASSPLGSIVGKALT